MMSCVMRSPCCSQSTSSRARSVRSGESLRRSRRSRLARWTLRPDSSTRSSSPVSRRLRSRSTEDEPARATGRCATPFTTCSRKVHRRETARAAARATLRVMDETLSVGELQVRISDGLVLADGQPITLSQRELRLLIALLRAPDRIIPREELYHRAWDRPLRSGDRSVDVYVHKLRSKLEDALPHRRFIHTHFGFGYRLSPEPSHPFHKTATAR